MKNRLITMKRRTFLLYSIYLVLVFFIVGFFFNMLYGYFFKEVLIEEDYDTYKKDIPNYEK